MLYKIYLIIAAIFVAFFLYLSSINKETVFIGTGSSGFEVSAILLVFIAFLTGFLISYLISIAKTTRSYIETLKGKKGLKKTERSESLVKNAKKAFLLGNRSEGELLLRECIASPFDKAEPYAMLIKYYLEEKDLDKAFDVLDKLPASLSSDVEILYRKAEVLIEKRSFDRAIEVLKELDEKENRLETKRLLRDAYISADLWDKAWEVQEKILKLPKKGIAEEESDCTSRIGYEIIKGFIKRGNDAESIKRLKELIKKGPANTKPYVSLGKLYWEKGDRKLAEETLGKGFEKTENLIFLFILEDYLLKDGEPQKIIDKYKALISKNPENPLLHLFLGKLYLRLEMLDEALESLEKTLELNPGFPHVYKMLGEAYFRMEKYRDASEKFKEALGFKRGILVPLVCRACGAETFQWDGSCPDCGAWESLHVETGPKKTGDE